VTVFQRSDARAVPSRIITLPRVLVVATAVLLVSATISLAADKPTTATKATMHSNKPQQVMVVPDVTGQLFVFASGSLEDAGFGWKVRGSVGGYQSNMVVSQSPKAGSHVLDTGEPTITLQLERKGAQLGTPQNRSPYGASLIKRPNSSK
jgi:beta-lactam-binding protein with PASTA domain